MTRPKLTPEQGAALQRRIERLIWSMEDGQRAFFYEHPDALKAVFEGDLQGYFERMRRQIPPSGLTKYAMHDASGWKALEDGKALISAVTHGVGVDYRPDRADVLLLARVFDDPDDTEDLEDMMERRKIVRAGGTVDRRLKRLWFDGDACVSEVEGLIRLKGWKPVDARTLLAWSGLHRHEIEMHDTVLASVMPLLRRDGNTIRLVSGVTRMRDRNGPFYGFKRVDPGPDTLKPFFTSSRSFLVEVPDDRGA